MTFDDIIDSVWPFEKAHEAMEYVWQGRVRRWAGLSSSLRRHDAKDEH